MSTATESGARCAICGSEEIERHHVGGKNHIVWFTMPLCVTHHRQLSAVIAAAKIDFTYTDDPKERLVRAQEACQVFQWMLSQAQRELNSKVTNEEQNISV